MGQLAFFKTESPDWRMATLAVCNDCYMFGIRRSVRPLWAFICAQISGLTQGIIISVQFAGVRCFEISSLSLSGAILRPHLLFAISASLGCRFSPVALLEPRILPMSSTNFSVLEALLAWKGQNHGWRVNLQLLRSYKNVSEHGQIRRKICLFASFLSIGRMYTENLI